MASSSTGSICRLNDLIGQGWRCALNEPVSTHSQAINFHFLWRIARDDQQLHIFF